MLQLKHSIFADGERYPILLDSQGMPDFWTTMYVTVNLRDSHTQSSIENSLRHIIHLRLWEKINDRDLISEFSQEKFLSKADIFSLRNHCFGNTRDLRSWSQRKIKKNVAKLSVSHPSRLRHMESVSRLHTANRIAEIRKFLIFTAKALLRQRSNYASIYKLIEIMDSNIASEEIERTGKKGMEYDPDSKAPPPEIFDEFMKVIKVDSPDNPFKNISVRKRNALIFEILYETGIRSGELLSLRVSDIDYNAGKVRIVRRHDDPIDPRPKQPVPKTLGRNLDISLDLAGRIRAYVMEERSKVVKINSAPLLFVTHKKGSYQGKPISDASFRNRILGAVTSTNPELFSEVTRHGFRHNLNYIFSKKIDAINALSKIDPTVAPINDKQEMDARKLQNGWSSNDSAEIYMVRKTREIVKKVSLADGADMAKHIKK